MSFSEIASVASIGPFMAIVGDITQLYGNGYIAKAYQASGVGEPYEFLVLIGIIILFILLFTAALSMFTIWRLSMYGARVGADLGSRLYRYYMYRPWMFHVENSSDLLTSRIAQETQRVTNQVINPLMHMNAKFVMATFMATAMFFYNPFVALLLLALFTVSYVTLFSIVRRKLGSNGRKISDSQQMRYKLLAEGFGGIKDILLLGRQRHFTEQFEKESRKFAISVGSNQTLWQAPRYALELVAFGSAIILILYLLVAYKGDTGKILPLLSVYALAGLKILPAFQQVYSSLSQIKGNVSALRSIKSDLAAARKIVSSSKDLYYRLTPKAEIKLDHIVFQYPNKMEAALNEINITIPVNRIVGIVGASGSGKSTLIDLLLGLIQPSEGSFLIDGKLLTGVEVKAWQNSVGFVPQSIFLSNGSVWENVAFGVPISEIDQQKVIRALELSHLSDLISTLPQGLDTIVGERGVFLSGGQRQRIGIARALYQNPDILVLDEATSALDGISEKLVMDSIHRISGQKTIIIVAHRLATIKECDVIFLLDKGRVLDSGTFDELSERNAIFKEMANRT
ncbi:MAG: ABC transporter ATP-binding protein [Marinobacter sp.]|uniref:ABC transporter ATP-binding protein n=1 Tax=Marinobacter sp. TaxID=50741 RepID=UPI00299E042C|nr:ABC transporter ATP-binding protein [Marinobacter sp.]MDX1756685.1 ABC transporter ATP-binding protein [Marinobacter sp.]